MRCDILIFISRQPFISFEFRNFLCTFFLSKHEETLLWSKFEWSGAIELVLFYLSRFGFTFSLILGSEGTCFPGGDARLTGLETRGGGGKPPPHRYMQ